MAQPLPDEVLEQAVSFLSSFWYVKVSPKHPPKYDYHTAFTADDEPRFGCTLTLHIPPNSVTTYSVESSYNNRNSAKEAVSRLALQRGALKLGESAAHADAVAKTVLNPRQTGFEKMKPKKPDMTVFNGSDIGDWADETGRNAWEIPDVISMLTQKRQQYGAAQVHLDWEFGSAQNPAGPGELHGATIIFAFGTEAHPIAPTQKYSSGVKFISRKIAKVEAARVALSNGILEFMASKQAKVEQESTQGIEDLSQDQLANPVGYLHEQCRDCLGTNEGFQIETPRGEGDLALFGADAKIKIAPGNFRKFHLEPVYRSKKDAKHAIALHIIRSGMLQELQKAQKANIAATSKAIGQASATQTMQAMRAAGTDWQSRQQPVIFNPKPGDVADEDIDLVDNSVTYLATCFQTWIGSTSILKYDYTQSPSGQHGCVLTVLLEPGPAPQYSTKNEYPTRKAAKQAVSSTAIKRGLLNQIRPEVKKPVQAVKRPAPMPEEEANRLAGPLKPATTKFDPYPHAMDVDKPNASPTQPNPAQLATFPPQNEPTSPATSTNDDFIPLSPTQRAQMPPQPVHARKLSDAPLKPFPNAHRAGYITPRPDAVPIDPSKKAENRSTERTNAFQQQNYIQPRHVEKSPATSTHPFLSPVVSHPIRSIDSVKSPPTTVQEGKAVLATHVAPVPTEQADATLPVTFPMAQGLRPRVSPAPTDCKSISELNDFCIEWMGPNRSPKYRITQAPSPGPGLPQPQVWGGEATINIAKPGAPEDVRRYTIPYTMPTAMAVRAALADLALESDLIESIKVLRDNKPFKKPSHTAKLIPTEIPTDSTVHDAGRFNKLDTTPIGVSVPVNHIPEVPAEGLTQPISLINQACQMMLGMGEEHKPVYTFTNDPIGKFGAILTIPCDPILVYEIPPDSCQNKLTAKDVVARKAFDDGVIEKLKVHMVAVKTRETEERLKAEAYAATNVGKLEAYCSITERDLPEWSATDEKISVRIGKQRFELKSSAESTSSPAENKENLATKVLKLFRKEDKKAAKALLE